MDGNDNKTLIFLPKYIINFTVCAFILYTTATLILLLMHLYHSDTSVVNILSF